jgi:N-acetylglutamate synthase-like GNAT family acetyltransferase
MAALSPIPLETEIVDNAGKATTFFRLRWQQLIDNFNRAALVASIEALGRTAAIAAANAYVPTVGGNYRVTVAVQKVVADGVSSSVTVTLGWTSRGIPMTKTFPAFTTDAVGASDSTPWQFNADQDTPITYALAYASNTPEPDAIQRECHRGVAVVTSRILPRDEWSKLAGTEAGAFADRLPVDSASLLVVEDDGQIVATWALVSMVHAEGLWIAPSHRGRFGVVKRLLAGMRAMARSIGCPAVQTAALSSDVADFIARLGGAPLPGQAFVLPLESSACQQR